MFLKENLDRKKKSKETSSEDSFFSLYNVQWIKTLIGQHYSVKSYDGIPKAFQSYFNSIISRNIYILLAAD